MEIIKLVTGNYGTNTYILIQDGAAIVIDPGENAEAIAEKIKSKNAVLKHILITHAHFDHVGAVADLKHDGVTVYMPRADFDVYDDIYSVGANIYVKPFDVDVKVKDGDVLKLLGHEFAVIETPGHTPGSSCYVLDDNTIFSGDTLFRLSVGRSDFIGGDSVKLNKSLKKLFALVHDYDVLPGHGLPTKLYYEREFNPYVN